MTIRIGQRTQAPLSEPPDITPAEIILAAFVALLLFICGWRVGRAQFPTAPHAGDLPKVASAAGNPGATGNGTTD
jgi:hypothetical protein